MQASGYSFRARNELGKCERSFFLGCWLLEVAPSVSKLTQLRFLVLPCVPGQNFSRCCPSASKQRAVLFGWFKMISVFYSVRSNKSVSLDTALVKKSWIRCKGRQGRNLTWKQSYILREVNNLLFMLLNVSFLDFKWLRVWSKEQAQQKRAMKQASLNNDTHLPPNVTGGIQTGESWR